MAIDTFHQKLKGYAAKYSGVKAQNLGIVFKGGTIFSLHPSFLPSQPKLEVLFSIVGVAWALYISQVSIILDKDISSL